VVVPLKTACRFQPLNFASKSSAFTGRIFTFSHSGKWAKRTVGWSRFNPAKDIVEHLEGRGRDGRLLEFLSLRGIEADELPARVPEGVVQLERKRGEVRLPIRRREPVVIADDG